MRAADLTEQQKNIFDADTKHISWLIKVDIGNTGSVDYYWSTKKKTWDGHDYTFKIKDFTPLICSIGSPYLGILPSSKVTFKIPNEDNTLLASDFKGAAIIVTLVGKADLAIRGGADDIEFDSSSGGIVPDESDEQEAELISFGFKVKASSSVDQMMRLECVDWFQEYVEGDYPNTSFAADLWPADIMKEDTYCVPIVFGTAYFPLRWITSGGNDYYLLGSNTPTYTINRLRSPKEVNSKTEYLSSTYTFTQSALEGADGNNYKVVQAIISDSDNDGTNDANGFWGILGKEVYDVPFKFYRSDLYDKTDPAEIIEYLLEAWGVPSDKIDDTSKAAATAIFTARGFSLNIALWAPMSRKKLLCKILTISGMVLIIREKIYFKVLTTDSQLTIETGIVARGTFQVNPMLFTHTKKDSGYVFWQKSTEPLGQGYGNKNLIAAKSSTSNPSKTTIECEWINDDTGVKQQKAGKLALQRILLPDKTVNFRGKLKFGLVESGDIITVNPDDWDTDGTPYKVQIDKEIYHCNFIGIGVECTRFSDDLDDWDDLSESSITIATADNSSAYSPIYQGPRDAKTPDSGSKANEISKTVLIGTNGILATNDDPATNGGLKITDTEITFYDTDANILFKATYSGDNQGIKIPSTNGINWTSRTSAADNEWVSVCYGNGIFVAIAQTGTGNRVMTSSDGITWTIRTSAADNDWHSVCYGNGLFVAVADSGVGNRVMTSPDGITWTSRTSAADNDWYSVCYGNSLFVAVAHSGVGNRVMTSPDGITWTIRTSAADNEWTSVCYGNSLFVAVAADGVGNRVMTSPDGITWTIRTSAADNYWYSVCYGNGLYVAVAYTGVGNRVMTSPDGITWTSRVSVEDNYWSGVCYGNGLFIAVSDVESGSYRVMTSPDGIIWTSRASASGNYWYSVCYGDEIFIAVSISGTGNRVMTSGIY